MQTAAVRALKLFALAVGLCLGESHALAADALVADAAEKADWARVRTLLKDGADANATQVDGMTALHWAAYHDDLETAKLLLAAEANPKALNRYHVTPLSLACTN